MVVRKSQGGNKTPHGAQKPTPKKNVAEQDLEFDEDDDEDLEFADDSELDDEELDDEGTVDEELGEDMDEGKEQMATSPKSKQATPQMTPTKRKAEGSEASAAKRVRLEDYIPASQIVDHDERERRTLRLSNFHESVQFEDVRKICKGASGIHGKRKLPLRTLFAVYQTQEVAQAAMQELKKTKLKGKAVEVECCGNLPEDGKEQYSNTVIDVHNIPESTEKNELEALFPGSKLLRLSGRYAKLRFKSPSELKNAIKNPKCHVVGETKLRFSFVLARPGRRGRRRTKKTSATPAGKKSLASPAGKGKKSPKAKTPEKKASAPRTPSSTPRGKRVPTTPAGKRLATTAAGKGVPMSPAGKKVPTTPAGKQMPTTPANKGKKAPKGKTP